MRDFAAWSLNLGQWRGVQVRLHAIFLLFGVLTLYVSTRGPGPNMAGYGLLSLAILLLSVLAHEIGHCYAAAQVGGSSDQIVMAPWGGLTSPRVPREPQHELVTAVAGPLVNLCIWFVILPVLLLTEENVLGLLYPLEPTNILEGSSQVIVGLKLAFWINWVLVLLNLLPAFPMDGGRIFRSFLAHTFGVQNAVKIVARGAMLIAIGLCLFAWLKRDSLPEAPLPAWVPLLLFAIFLYFSARQEVARTEEQEAEDELFAYDFSQGYTSLDKSLEPIRPMGLSPLRRWVKQRREARRLQKLQLEQEEERQVDAILIRLNEVGLSGLSPKERALLERVSARYRSRQQSD
jgi:Zn-dependent protease